MVMAVMATCFPAPITPEQYCNKPDFYRNSLRDSAVSLPADLRHTMSVVKENAGDVNYIFYTKPGPGPLPAQSDSLLDSNGFPTQPAAKHRKLVIPSKVDAQKGFVPLDSPNKNHCHGHNSHKGSGSEPKMMCYHGVYTIAALAFAVGAGLAIGILKSR
jgi:hypothetical protein